MATGWKTNAIYAPREGSCFSAFCRFFAPGFPFPLVVFCFFGTSHHADLHLGQTFGIGRGVALSSA